MESMVELIVGILAGCLLGGVTIWLVQGSRAKSRLARMEADWVKEKASLREENAGLKGQLEQSNSAEKIVEMAKEQLNERFQATASQALQANNSQFMDLAQENLGKTLEAAKGDFKQRHEQFEALVKPLAENYQKLNPQIDLLAKRSESIAEEATKLSSALTDNRQIGNWGRGTAEASSRTGGDAGILRLRGAGCGERLADQARSNGAAAGKTDCDH